MTVNGTDLSTSTDILIQISMAAARPHPTRQSDVCERRRHRGYVPRPRSLHGVFAVHLIGSANAPLLQIVPVVTSLDVVSTGSLQLRGKGFVEGNGSTYTFGSTTVTDNDNSSSPIDAGGFFLYDNDGVRLPLPTPTASATSRSPPPAEPARRGHGLPPPQPQHALRRGLQCDQWPAVRRHQLQILRIDPATGQTLASFGLPGGNSGNTGLQVLPTAMTLNGVNIPAGSLLVTNGNASFDNIYALNPTNGVILATRDLGQDIDPVAGLYDPVSGSLFILDGSPDQVLKINPATGAIQSSFPISIDINYGGMALDPTTGNLWIGSNNTNSVSEYTTAGVLVRTIDLTSQGLTNGSTAWPSTPPDNYSPPPSAVLSISSSCHPLIQGHRQSQRLRRPPRTARQRMSRSLQRMSLRLLS